MQDSKRLVRPYICEISTQGQQGPSAIFQAVSTTVAVRAEHMVDQFIEGLNNLLGSGPRKLRDAEFDSLTEWCSYNGKIEYAKRPRTLALLKWSGCLDAIEGFVNADLSDVAIPYEEGNLPPCIKGQQMRSKFVELQKFVLANNQAKALEIPESPHLHFQRSADSFFYQVRVLGSGGFGTVSHVISKLKLAPYALKRIPRGRSFNRDQVQIQSFTNELRALKVLSHKHLVKLVGSYTDEEHVGLLMTPVADVNLAVYLTLPDEQAPGRADCLRNFFGCLAAGIKHLHTQQIRHKDIKPLNVLVLIRTGRVLLTDFGTSRNWTNDESSGSNGTISQAYTERYCAPEVSNRMPRNSASDIWSLGLIFLEMSTVLAGFTVQQMQDFFERNGNGKQFVRQNPIALQIWYQQVAHQVSLPIDLQVLELTKRMLQFDPIERPTAAQIVAEIVDFLESIRYHCGCCEVNHNKWMPSHVVEYMQDSTKTEERDLERLETLQTAAFDLSNGRDPASWATYQPPRIQDIQEDMTVLHYDAAGEAVCVPKVQTGQVNHDVIPAQSSSVQMPLLVESQVHQESTTISTQANEATPVSCKWPTCSVSWPVEDRDPFLGHLLWQHYRTAHSCHEFGLHLWLIRQTEKPQRDSASEITCLEIVPSADNATASPSEIDPMVSAIYAARLSRREKRVDEKAVYTVNTKVESSGSERAIRHVVQKENSRGHIRFDKLPEDRRPEAAPPPITPQVPEEDLDFQSHVENAFLPNTWPFLTPRGRDDQPDNGFSPPVSSFVPSFHLAASNRFTQHEVDQAQVSGARPLFVYGTLMFPSILKACASFYTNATGVYEPLLQRRLQTTGADWANANSSIKSAAQCMTPALIYAGPAIRPPYSPWATTRLDSEDHEVHGFLIFGLSPEAYRCLNHWLNEELPARFGFNSAYGSVREFRRHPVYAEIQQADSQDRAVLADTFSCTEKGYNMWSRSWLKTSYRTRRYQTIHLWDRNEFARSHEFATLCSEDWMDEEEQLADDMKMRCLMRGDILAIAVVEQDMERIEQILNGDFDVNAKCHQYGTALQAAAAKGNFMAAEELLRRGANANAINGSYGCPLIAACIYGHIDIVRLLLKYKANVLAEGGRHINALYQAVAFSDVELGHILLEKGAWLVPNYSEILDLAKENGNRDMMRMLEDYDVRDLHKDKSITYESESDHSSSRSRRAVSCSSLAYIPYEERLTMDKGRSSGLLQAVMLEALSLRGKSGKWTGIKAVRVLRRALAKGASPSIIDKAAPYLKDYQSLIEWLNRCQNDYNAEFQPDDSGGGDLLEQMLRQPQPRTHRLTDATAPPSDSGIQDSRRDSGSFMTDVTCRACYGRGGAEGMEQRCRECAEPVNNRRHEGNNSRRADCAKCRGRGYYFSARDMCQECYGEGMVESTWTNEDSKTRYSGRGNDVPPPYTTR